MTIIALALALSLGCEKYENPTIESINTIYPVITYYARGDFLSETYVIEYRQPQIGSNYGVWKDTAFVGEWKYSIPYNVNYGDSVFELRQKLPHCEGLVDFQVYFKPDANSEEFAVGQYYKQCANGLYFSEADFGYNDHFTPLVPLPYASILDKTNIRPVITYHIQTASPDDYTMKGDSTTMWEVEFTDPRFGDEIQVDSFTGEWTYHIPYEQNERFYFKMNMYSNDTTIFHGGPSFNMNIFINDIGVIYGSGGSYDVLGTGSIVDRNGKTWKIRLESNKTYTPDFLYDYYKN